MSTTRKRNGFWDKIDSLETARQAANQGVWAAGLVAAITTGLILVSMAMGEVPEGMPAINAWAFWDVGLFVAIGWGIRKMSRVAAVAGLVLYILEQVVMRISNPALSTSGFFVTGLLILAFTNAIRGTFAYHAFRTGKLVDDTPPES
ncbi:MAG: hypothetical protein HC827_11930 [Cyanobacteria bacterium RM1_2_2]|nr:hypothetical protein [Cyanobacteria bacterium RM1_2_2]